MDAETQDDVAIIGLSLRFPQDAVTPASFWKMLLEGRSAATKVPADRFNVDAFYHPDPDRLDSMNCKGGNFVLGDLGAFDAPFFSLSPAEAACIDPQQRILLETSYRALENAGIPIENLSGTNTSVHVGCFSHEYEIMFARDPESLAKYQASGTGPAMLANRLSWFYNIHGPSIPLDTACSSSMNALYLSAHNLLSHETDLGIVGGCNLILNPDSVMTPLANLNFLSPDSRCYPFDARANGYSRGEGFGVIILKRVADAVADGDTIRAIIRSIGVNQDGRTPGITQPNRNAQEAMIRETYAKRNLDMGMTRFFEAHGTGTPVGDLIESKAISSVFTAVRSPQDPLYVGATKSNIGHLEGASGMASIIKTVLALENGIIPPNADFRSPHPDIKAEERNMKFPNEAIAWPCNGVRRASINSFGYGGANVHVVLDDALHYLEQCSLSGKHNTCRVPHNPKEPPLTNGALKTRKAFMPQLAAKQPRALVLSASDEASLQNLIATYTHHMTSCTGRTDPHYITNLCYTLSNRRSALPWRTYAVCHSSQDLPEHLRTSFSKPIRSRNTQNLTFVFTGQGAQWRGMGRDLLGYYAFRESLERASDTLHHLGFRWSLLEAMLNTDHKADIDRADLSQPLCTALQIALVDLLASWGIYASNVIGHSSGEIAAAYCAGGISKSSALRIAYFRGKLASATHAKKRGAMMSVALPEASAEAIIREASRTSKHGCLAIGCVNSPSNVTLTGDIDCIDQVQHTLEKQNIFAKKLAVPVAYHSPAMESIADEYMEAIDDIRLSKICDPLQVRPRMFSSVTGKAVSVSNLNQPEYWVANLISKVRFSDALIEMNRSTGRDAKADCVIEIGPHSALRRPVRDTLPDIEYLSVLQKDHSGLNTCLHLVGHLYCKGFPLSLLDVNNLDPKRIHLQSLVDLPEYTFNHSQSHWVESRISKELRFRKHARHELLGTPLPTSQNSSAKWRNHVKKIDNPWIMDHRSGESVLYPASGMLVMAIEAMRQLMADSPLVSLRKLRGFRLVEVMIYKALLLTSNPEGVETEISLYLPKTGGSKDLGVAADFHISALLNDQWSDICEGTILTDFETTSGDLDCCNEEEVRMESLSQSHCDGAARCRKPVISRRKMYEFADKVGYGFGPTFQTLHAVSHSGGLDATATVYLDEWKGKVSKGARITQSYLIHPTTLDGIFQATIVALTEGATKVCPNMVPTRVRDFWVSNELLSEASGEGLSVNAQISFQGFRETEFSITALGISNGRPYVAIEGYRITAVDDSSRQSRHWRRLCFNVTSKPDVASLDSDQLAKICGDSTDIPQSLPQSTIHDWEVACLVFMMTALEVYDGEKGSVKTPHLQKYIAWMRYRCDHLWSTYGSTLVPILHRLRDDAYLRRKFLSDVEQMTPEGRLFVSVGKQLPNFLNGRSDPLEALFRDDLLQNFYAGPGMFVSYNKMAAYVDLLAHKNPNMSILEVGAGTGGASAVILNVLGGSHGSNPTTRFNDYDYTDVSPSFFEAAKERFHHHGNRMSFRVLDISTDPSVQGFESKKYDLVIASAVLHATENISKTLLNSRKLLKPGGKLLLMEPTSLQCSRIPFVFGLLPGWWLSTEPTRKWGPLLSEDQWRRAFAENGFDTMDVCLADNEDPELHAMSVLVASASDVEAVIEKKPVVILVEPESLLQNRLASRLNVSLQEAGLSSCIRGTVEPIVSVMVEFTSVVSLLEVEKPLLAEMSEGLLTSLKSVLNSARDLLWIVGNGNEENVDSRSALINGLATTLRSEYHNYAIRTLTFEDWQKIPENVIPQEVRNMIRDQQSGETDLAIKDGIRYINRIYDTNSYNDQIWAALKPKEPEIQPFGSEETRSLTLTIAQPGLLDTLRFVDDPMAEEPLGSDEVSIRVMATGVNFKDIMVAMGQLPEKVLGQECSGVIDSVGRNVEGHFKPGDRVCCLVGGAYKTHVRSHISAVAKIPDNYTYAQAATLPVVYCTAYYSLFHVARLRKGESILIHSAAGGVGQAAIALAKIIGAEVYLTVSTDEKRDLLMKTYGIPSDRFFSSRNTSFASGIRRLTDGRGVDVVLNSLSGDLLKASWECIAPLGRFVEIGKRDIESNSRLSMSPFAKNVTFASVDLGIVAAQARPVMKELMTKVMALVFESKVAPPQPLHIFGGDRMEEAFRYLQSGKNTGKTVLEIGDGDVVPIMPFPKPSWGFDPHATYVITGAFGGLGASAARWMMGRGARHLLLLSRSGPQSQTARMLLSNLELGGVSTLAPACDIGNEASLGKAFALVDHATNPIKGCIHGAMALKDSLFTNMTAEAFKYALNPKVAGSRNLHTHLPASPNLDFFLILSSTGAIIGNPGQANYASGSAYQDALARYRVTHGQKCISLNLGLMLDIGYASEKEDLTASLKAAGHDGIDEAEFHALLEVFCDPNLTIDRPEDAHVITGLSTPAGLRRRGIDEPSWMKRPIFKPLYEMDKGSSDGDTLAASSQQKAANWPRLLKDAPDTASAASIVVQALVQKLAKTLFVQEDDVDTSRPMGALGIDSLVAIELRHWFAGELKTDVPVLVILGNESVMDVGKYVAEKLGTVEGEKEEK